MEISIREAVADDLDALIRLHGLFMEHHVACDDRFTLRSGVTEKWRERISAAVDDPETLVLVAVEGTDFVGCAYTLIRPGAMDFGPDRIGYLCDVFVEPRYRRNGIARRFLSASQSWLREREIHTIEASWAVGSDEAQCTWPSLGLTPISIRGKMEF
jgi:GNAT superfamily N-acetyltransferase